MHKTPISPSFCPCQVRPSCDCSLSVSSCFGGIAACFHSWRPSSVYSALLPTCCELEAGMIYPGTQPQTASFNFQGNSRISWGWEIFTTYSFTVHTAGFLRSWQLLFPGLGRYLKTIGSKKFWKKVMEIGFIFLRPNVFIVLFFQFYPKGDNRKILY